MNNLMRVSAPIVVVALSLLTGLDWPSRGGESLSADELKKEVSQLENLWKAGNHWRPGRDCGYFVKADRLATDIAKSPADSDTAKLAAPLLSSLLSKKFDISEVTTEDLEKDETEGIGFCDLQAMECLANYLMSHPNMPGQDRVDTARLLARYVGRVRSERILNYQPKDMRLDLLLPRDGNEPLATGMDPDEIQDPVVKAKYKAACRALDESNVDHMRQTQLQRMDQSPDSEAITDYLITTFRGRRDGAAILDECMKAAKLTDPEKQKVLKQVGPR